MFVKVFFISLTLIIPLTQAGESSANPVFKRVDDTDLKISESYSRLDCETSVCECSNAFIDTKTKCDPALAKGKIQCLIPKERPPTNRDRDTAGDITTQAETQYVELENAKDCIKGSISAFKNACEETARKCENLCEQAIEDTENEIEKKEKELNTKEKKQDKTSHDHIEEQKLKSDIAKIKDKKYNSEKNEQACGDHYTTFFEDMNSFLGSVLSRLTPTIGEAVAIADLVGRFSQGGKGEKTPGPGGGDPHAECIKRGWIWNAKNIIKCKKPTDPLDGGNGGKPTGGDPFGPLQPSGDPKGNPKGDPNGPNAPSPLNTILPPGGSGNTANGGDRLGWIK